MTRRFGEIRVSAIVPISLKRGVMFGGSLLGYRAISPQPVTHIIFMIHRSSKRAIKVISTSSGFAAVQRETFKRKTLKILAKFGVAAPSPWGKHQNLNPRENHPGHSSNRNCKRLFRSCYGFPTNVPPVSPLTFCQNFVEKIPCPSP